MSGKSGFIDKSGKEVIPMKYELADPFFKGIALVSLDRDIGYIGRDGTEYFEP
ncbi:MAG TPA: WG repeat-containing protein [Pyrinomonadaceae bacterium]|jgi:hypothetical protein